MKQFLEHLRHWLHLLHRAHVLLVFVALGLVLGATAGMMLTQRIVGVVLGAVLGIWAMVYLFHRWTNNE
jgi:hypothetical protein